MNRVAWRDPFDTKLVSLACDKCVSWLRHELKDVITIDIVEPAEGECELCKARINA